MAFMEVGISALENNLCLKHFKAFLHVATTI